MPLRNEVMFIGRSTFLIKISLKILKLAIYELLSPGVALILRTILTLHFRRFEGYFVAIINYNYVNKR